MQAKKPPTHLKLIKREETITIYDETTDTRCIVVFADNINQDYKRLVKAVGATNVLIKNEYDEDLDDECCEQNMSFFYGNLHSWDAYIKHCLGDRKIIVYDFDFDSMFTDMEPYIFT